MHLLYSLPGKGGAALGLSPLFLRTDCGLQSLDCAWHESRLRTQDKWLRCRVVLFYIGGDELFWFVWFWVFFPQIEAALSFLILYLQGRTKSCSAAIELALGLFFYEEIMQLWWGMCLSPHREKMQQLPGCTSSDKSAPSQGCWDADQMPNSPSEPTLFYGQLKWRQLL